jgi:hypothetical protein
VTAAGFSTTGVLPVCNEVGDAPVLAPFCNSCTGPQRFLGHGDAKKLLQTSETLANRFAFSRWQRPYKFKDLGGERDRGEISKKKLYAGTERKNTAASLRACWTTCGSHGAVAPESWHRKLAQEVIVSRKHVCGLPSSKQARFGMARKGYSARTIILPALPRQVVRWR